MKEEMEFMGPVKLKTWRSPARDRGESSGSWRRKASSSIGGGGGTTMVS